MMTSNKRVDVAFWLMKSEPDAYGIEDLRREGTTLWDGIRNYQARNFMRNMEVGDQAFFYHSNCKPPGIIGLMEVMETAWWTPPSLIRRPSTTTPNQPPRSPAGTVRACDFSASLMRYSVSTSCGRSTANSSCP